jgi:adenine-specific DNA-methyltransferase
MTLAGLHLLLEGEQMSITTPSNPEAADAEWHDQVLRPLSVPPLTLVSHSGTNLLARAELQRLSMSAVLAADPAKRAELGQFFTPASVAAFMASMIDTTGYRGTLRLLDAGCGNGMLTAAAVAAICAGEQKPAEIIATAWELDDRLVDQLRQTCEACRLACEEAGIHFTADIRQGDFIWGAVNELRGVGLFGSGAPQFDLAILNPPYRKLNSDSDERQRLRDVGIETSNLYAAFVWLAVGLLSDGGQLVAITPRSYMNGSYFKPFRSALLGSMRFRRVHVYETRNTAFVGDDVLQENAIISAVKGGAVSPVTVTTSQGPEDEGISSCTLHPAHFVRPGDPDAVMYIVPGDCDAQIGERMRGLPCTLSELGVRVSTGRVVEFRARERLRVQATVGDAPLIFPRHVTDGYVAWPREAGTKPNAIRTDGDSDPVLFPSGWYVIVKRFSAKEEKRRVVAALFDPARLPSPQVGFDNKLNVIHRNGAGLSPEIAKGLAVFLNSTVVDAYFRQFSGHTQVNAGDLRSLRFPERDIIERIGRRINGRMPAQDEINQIIREEVPSMAEGTDPVAAKTKVQAALGALKSLNAPKDQQNERSALTLLALLDLLPTAEWTAAADPHRGVTEIMDWMSANYGKRYAPNTRETVRRFTLHQFIEMGLVVLNPDNPARPPNSPNNVYQVEPSALELLRTFGSSDWEKNLADYLGSVQGKNRLREAARKMSRIPVTLPDGQTIQLSGGGQNILIKEIIEQFAPRFTPGGHVIYVGDAGERQLLNDEAYLQNLGVVIDHHGKMPDVVIHYRDRDWLVLIEAVTSHGPVNLLRHTQLKDLFAGSKAGLVFVTAFLDRRTMREYLPDIAWETEVWVADAPAHLIHFNGSRFLGPYGT